jgi:metal-sulfur cluster biosynthetic enzyme
MPTLYHRPGTVKWKLTMLSEQTIHDALRDCYDPEIPLNIVDLGLVQSIRLTQDPDAPGSGIPGVPPRFRAEITVILTNPDDAPQAQLTAQIANRLAGLFEISHTHVHVADTPAWTPALISPAGRRILKLDQPAFPILNNRIR